MPSPRRGRWAALMLVAWLFATPASPEEAAHPATSTLTLVVDGAPSDEGVLVVALASSAAEFESGDTFFRADAAVPIEEGRAERVFEAVPHGVYAVKVFHDVNANGELDTNFVGMPKEPFGFSNDAMGRFGPPSFQEAAFQVESDPARVAIRLR